MRLICEGAPRWEKVRICRPALGRMAAGRRLEETACSAHSAPAGTTGHATVVVIVVIAEAVVIVVIVVVV